MLKLNPLLLLLLILMISLNIVAQDYYVSEIHFSGTHKIKTDFLFKNIELKTGDTLSINQLERDLLSLTSLPPVSKSTFKIDTLTDSNVSVNYIILDAITFIPGITVGNRGDNLWIGAGVSSLNLFKNGQQASVNYVRVDQQHNVELFYKILYIGKSKWSLGTTIYRHGSLEPLFFKEGTFEYNYTIKTLGVFPAYRFTPRHSLELPISIFQETYSLQNNDNLGPPIGIPSLDTKHKSLIELNYQSNKVKYDYFLLHGIYNRISVQWVKTFGEAGNFYSLTNITKKFIQIGKGTNIALRLKLSLASNGDSPFAPFVLDNDANIRGVGSRVQRGTGEVLSNLELRQTLFAAGNFASQILAFTDIGSWRAPGGTFSDFVDSDIIALHTGAGLRFIYTRGHNYILRIDYGFDAINGAKNSNGFVLGIGQYF